MEQRPQLLGGGSGYTAVPLVVEGLSTMRTKSIDMTLTLKRPDGCTNCISQEPLFVPLGGPMTPETAVFHPAHRWTSPPLFHSLCDLPHQWHFLPKEHLPPRPPLVSLAGGTASNFHTFPAKVQSWHPVYKRDVSL